MGMITVPISVPKDMAPYLNFEEKGLAFGQSAMLPESVPRGAGF